MYKVFLSIISFLSSVVMFAQQAPFLITPVEGVQGVDWEVVNYVDWDTVGYQDYNCGSKSYDGHQGTDYVLPSFAAMDDSVAVLAAASGRVTYVIDSIFDRETEGIIAKQLGNFIAISHPNKYYTYYAHLMKGSAKVAVGDSVAAGDLLGYVGSSGNSTDPHLHFELWYDSLFNVDPMAGPCGNEGGLFIDPPDYVTGTYTFESGLHLSDSIGIGHLRERFVSLERPYSVPANSDSVLYFWAHIHGLIQGETLTLNWYTPDDILWFEFPVTIDRDYWYYYYWSFINITDLEEGEWRAELIYQGEPIINESFKVESLSSVASENKIKCGFDINDYSQTNEADIYDMRGIKTTDKIHELQRGAYIIQHNHMGRVCTHKYFSR